MKTVTKTKNTKSNKQTLKDVLGAEAYLEYKSDNDVIIRNQDKIASKQVGLITQKVEDKFERRLVEEFSKLDKKITVLDKKITEEISKLRQEIHDGFQSQLKWIIGTFIITFSVFGSAIFSLILFLHK